MKTYKFKTTAKCGGCVAKIEEELRKITNSGTWEFDLSHPDKTLTITTSLSPQEVAKIISDAGYKAEEIK